MIHLNWNTVSLLTCIRSLRAPARESRVVQTCSLSSCVCVCVCVGGHVCVCVCVEMASYFSARERGQCLVTLILNFLKQKYSVTLYLANQQMKIAVHEQVLKSIRIHCFLGGGGEGVMPPFPTRMIHVSRGGCAQLTFRDLCSNQWLHSIMYFMSFFAFSKHVDCRLYSVYVLDYRLQCYGC